MGEKMVLTIKQVYNDYKLTVSAGRGSGMRGYSDIAKSKQEVIEGVKHYLSMEHDKEHCPFCMGK